MPVLQDHATSVASIDGLTIHYDQSLLEPRPWTAEQGRWAADLALDAPPGPMLEVCSGAGHIGLVAAARSSRPLVQVDANPAALPFARRNAEAAGLSTSVEVRCSTIDDERRRADRYPIVIADPPYIPSDETGRFPEDPLLAIDGGPDGLDLARACVGLFADVLVDGGSGLLQLGRPDDVRELAEHREDELVLAEHRTVAPDRHLVRFVRRPRQVQGGATVAEVDR